LYSFTPLPAAPKRNNGTFTRVQLVNGLFGKAHHFSSVKERVSLASNSTLDLKGPLSIAVRVQVRTLGLHQHIVTCDNRFALWFTDSNRLRFGNTLADGIQARVKGPLVQPHRQFS
jgi:hypothetical protein